MPLARLLVDDAVQMDRLPRPGLDRLGEVRIEAADALAADHEIAVAPVTQPDDVVDGGHAGIHDHQGLRWRLERR